MSSKQTKIFDKYNYKTSSLFQSGTGNQNIWPGWKNNGEELQRNQMAIGFDFNWSDYGARMPARQKYCRRQDWGGYDAALARFTTLDPLSDNYSFQSPYVYAVNNPILYIDWMGMGPDDRKNKRRKKPIFNKDIRGGGLAALFGGLRGKYFKNTSFKGGEVDFSLSKSKSKKKTFIHPSVFEEELLTGEKLKVDDSDWTDFLNKYPYSAEDKEGNVNRFTRDSRGNWVRWSDGRIFRMDKDGNLVDIKTGEIIYIKPNDPNNIIIPDNEITPIQMKLPQELDGNENIENKLLKTESEFIQLNREKGFNFNRDK